MRRLLSLCCAAMLLAATAAPALAAPGGQSAANQTMWYLSLGDSLAAGYQPTGDPANLYRTDQGYAEQLLKIARASGYPKLQLAKFGCPGATTVSFIKGDAWCPFEEGSQLAQAVVFLKAHKDNVAFVTIDIGWNDFQGCDKVPIPQLPACVQAGATSVATHLPEILARLQEAAPGVPIVGATIYDPFLVLWPQDPLLAMYSVQLIQYANAAETGVFAGMFHLPVADVEGAFHTTDFTIEANGLPLNLNRICAWTWKCSVGDNHPNATGYGVIASAFWNELK